MLSYEEFKESKRTDLVYRFLLWFFIGYFLCELLSNSIGDSFIEKVSTYFPSASYRIDFLIRFALLFGTAAIAFKDLGLFRNKNQKFTRYVSLNCIVKELSSFLVKISSDLLLITYATLSFLVGNAVFIYMYFYDEFPVDSAMKVLVALVAFFVFMALLGALSIFIRSTNEDWFYSKFWVIPLSKRLAFYSLVIFVALCII